MISSNKKHDQYFPTDVSMQKDELVMRGTSAISGKACTIAMIEPDIWTQVQMKSELNQKLKVIDSN
ncbi:hypothetical protein [Endozoicomonas lisbonensis]|uniref:Uncharacterized protein n=1 Tax=Endozoicomonas lisbonensis TaxID=3120522 RepID=A0ABV2SFW5_9GAMM